jgi:hypothetical protein
VCAFRDLKFSETTSHDFSLEVFELHHGIDVFHGDVFNLASFFLDIGLHLGFDTGFFATKAGFAALRETNGGEKDANGSKLGRSRKHFFLKLLVNLYEKGTQPV